MLLIYYIVRLIIFFKLKNAWVAICGSFHHVSGGVSGRDYDGYSYLWMVY